MLYPELFASLEKARWNMADDIAWDRFDASLLSDEQAHHQDEYHNRVVGLARYRDVPA